MLIKHATMNKIGRLLSEGTGGDVFQEGDEFFYHLSSWGLDENDDEFQNYSESEKFSSLEKLLASVPEGIIYLPAGETNISSEQMTKIHLAAEDAARKLRAVYAAHKAN